MNPPIHLKLRHWDGKLDERTYHRALKKFKCDNYIRLYLAAQHQKGNNGRYLVNADGTPYDKITMSEALKVVPENWLSEQEKSPNPEILIFKTRGGAYIQL